MEVMAGVHLDKRWNPTNPEILTYLVPGCGFGGSCFPKDIQALSAQGESVGLPMELLSAVLAINTNQPGQVRRILEMEVGTLVDKRILLLGLAFKPGTDDVRQSASLAIASDLLAAGANITAHDPIATENFIAEFGLQANRITFTSTWQDAIETADIIVVATKWNDYFVLAGQLRADQIVFDARRMLAPNSVQPARYLTVGRRLRPGA
jgi:UDPglucose 6-dehydrogenase